MLKCVPFNDEWPGSSSDLRAIYERRQQDNWGNPVLDADGNEQWDTTGPLPLRRHNDWVRKGFRYLTLADEDSLQKASGWLRSQGLDPMVFMQDRRNRSPFSLDLYMQGREERESAERAEWRRLVEKHGPETVVEIKGPLPVWLTRELHLPESDPAPAAGGPVVATKKPAGRPRKAEATA